MRELHDLLTSLGLDSDPATATAVLQKYDTNQTGLLELPEFSKFIRALGAHPASGGGADLNAALRAGASEFGLPHLRDAPEAPEARRRREGREASDDAELESLSRRQLEDEVRHLQQQLLRQRGGGGESYVGRSYGGGGGGVGGGDGVSQDMVRDVIRSVASELVGGMLTRTLTLTLTL